MITVLEKINLNKFEKRSGTKKKENRIERFLQEIVTTVDAELMMMK